MDDLVRRRDVIEHLKKRLYETELNSTAEHPYYTEIADNRVDIWMNELPSAQPETHEKRTETHACDCIERQAAIDAIDKALSRTFAEPCGEMILKDVPSAQLDPQRTGRWIPLQLSIAYPPYQCSCCFGNAPMVMVGTGRLKKGHLEALLTDFCPHCGADMRGGQDE